jgi:hypothetical protein
MYAVTYSLAVAILQRSRRTPFAERDQAAGDISQAALVQVRKRPSGIYSENQLQARRVSPNNRGILRLGDKRSAPPESLSSG